MSFASAERRASFVFVDYFKLDFFFGLCYLWLGITGNRERLFLTIAAGGGKISFSVLLIFYWFNNEIPTLAAAGSLSDLFFGLFFLLYLWQTRNADDSFEIKAI